MRRQVTASITGSPKRQATGLGRILDGALATRGTSLGADGSSAPSASLLCFLAVTVLALMGIAASAASAATPKHPFKEFFGSAAQPTFTTPQSLAVNQSTGDVLVMNKVGAGTGKVERFHSDGTASNFSATGTNTLTGFTFSFNNRSEIAVDNSSAATAGNIYVAQTTAGTQKELKIYDANGNEKATLTSYKAGANASGAETTFGSGICGVAVGPEGALYVGEAGFAGQIHKYVPSGVVPGVADNTLNISGIENPCTLAAGAGPTAGSIFVAGSIELESSVFKLNVTTGATAYTAYPSVSSGLSVDPVTGHLYVNDPALTVVELNVSGAVEASEVSQTKLESPPAGVAVNGSTGNLYTTREGSTGVEVWGPIAGHHFREFFGSAAQPTFTTPQSLAVNQSTGDVLVMNKVGAGTGKVERFHSDGTASNFSATGTNTLTGFTFSFNNRSEIAVDNSSAATAGNIYVAQTTAGTQKELKIYDANGNEKATLTSYKAGANASGAETTFGSGICGVAVGPEGALYVGEAGFAGQIHKYVPSGVVPGVADNTLNISGIENPCTLAAGAGPTAGSIFVAGSIELESSVFKLNATTGATAYTAYPSVSSGLSVDPVTGHLYVNDPALTVVELNVSGAVEASEVSQTKLESPPAGVAVNGSTGNLYTTREGSTGVEVWGVGAARSITVTVTGSGKVSETAGSAASAPPVSGSISNCTSAGGANCTATYFEGDEPELEAEADENNHLVEWTVAHSPSTTCTGTTSPCKVKIGAEDITTAVEFEFSGFELEVAKEGTGTGTVESDKVGGGAQKILCGAHCSEFFTPGEVVKLSGTPDAHSEAVIWTGGCDAIVGANECEVTMSAAKEVKADFTHIIHKLAAVPHGSGKLSAIPPPSPVSGGPISECQEGGPSSSCEATYDSGETVKLEATPAAHKEVLWSGCTAQLGDSCEVLIPDGADATVETSEVPITRTLTVAPSGSGGKVSASPGPISSCKESSGTCSGSYEENGSVTLTATPEANWEFSGWGAGECEAESGPENEECTFHVPATAKTVHATFVEAGKALLAIHTSGNGSGQIKCDGGACASEYDEGQVVSLEALPSGGHSRFLGWSATGSNSTTCAGTTNPCNVKIEPGPVSATAEFGKIKVTKVEPAEGPGSGGTQVTIEGENFGTVSGVKFGASAATFTQAGPNKVEATAPAHVAGAVEVIVETDSGSSEGGAPTYTYLAPTVTAVSPNEGPSPGGQVVTITGTGLTGASKVEFGSTAVTCDGTIAHCKVESATQIKATTPVGSAGTVDVTATTVGGTSATTAADHYTYVAPPTVTAVSPNEGPSPGGQVVTITGTGLTGASKVEFGSTAVTCDGTIAHCKVESATQIKATTPVGSAGTVDVTATTVGGTSATTAADHYTYVAPPTVTAVSPGEGPTAGANTVEITGTDLGGASSVKFGANTVSCPHATSPGKCVLISATKIEVQVPGRSAGTVDVTVTSVGGTSATTAADHYTYVAKPTITSVSPAEGSSAGGTSVTVKGTGFTVGTGFKFGANPATGVNVIGATEATMSAPVGSAGTVDVTATTVGGTSATTAADHYTYVAPANNPSNSPLGGSISSPPPPPLPETKCVVPTLKGSSLAKAKSALAAAHCALGKVAKPKAKKGQKTGALVVKSSSPGAGATEPEGAEVALKLAPKPHTKKAKKAEGQSK